MRGWFPANLTQWTDLFVVRSATLALYPVCLLTYTIAVGPTAIANLDEVGPLGQRLVIDPLQFIFTHPLGGALDDRWGHRPEAES